MRFSTWTEPNCTKLGWIAASSLLSPLCCILSPLFYHAKDMLTQSSHGCSSVVVPGKFSIVGNHGLQDVGPGIPVPVKHMLTVGHNKPKQSQIVRQRKTDLCHLLRFDKLNARNSVAERKKLYLPDLQRKFNRARKTYLVFSCEGRQKKFERLKTLSLSGPLFSTRVHLHVVPGHT